MVFGESINGENFIQITILNCFCISVCEDTCHDDATCSVTDLVPTCVCNSGYTGNGTDCDGKYNPHMLESKV